MLIKLIFKLENPTFLQIFIVLVGAKPKLELYLYTRGSGFPKIKIRAHPGALKLFVLADANTMQSVPGVKRSQPQMVRRPEEAEPASGTRCLRNYQRRS